MTTSFRFALGLAVITALAGCSQDAPDTEADTAATAPAAQPAAPTLAATADADASSQVLTMEQVDRYIAASAALAKATASDPSLDDVVSVDLSEETQAQHAADMAGHPKVAALLAQAGTTPAEYARLVQLVPAGFFAWGMMDSGQLKDVPEGVDPALIEFMKAHGREIAGKMKSAGLI